MLHEAETGHLRIYIDTGFHGFSDMVSFADISNGEKNLCFESYSLKKVLNSVCTLLQMRAELQR